MENNKVKEELVITDWQHNFSLEMTTLSRVVSNMLPQGENNLSLENIFLMMMPLVHNEHILIQQHCKKNHFPDQIGVQIVYYIYGLFSPGVIFSLLQLQKYRLVFNSRRHSCVFKKRDNMRHCRNWPSDFSWPADNEGEMGENKYTVVVPISLHHLQQNLGVLNYYLQLLKVHVYTENMLMS